MAGTTDFGPVTVNPGTRTFGPVALADTDAQLVLAIDRTPANGFNATPAASAKVSFEQSSNGGTTWDELCSATFIGGVFVIRGQTLTTSTVSTGLWPGSGRLGRAVVVISGSAVAVQGSLVIS